jgi:hypothetical protein
VPALGAPVVLLCLSRPRGTVLTGCAAWLDALGVMGTQLVLFQFANPVTYQKQVASTLTSLAVVQTNVSQLLEPTLLCIGGFSNPCQAPGPFIEVLALAACASYRLVCLHPGTRPNRSLGHRRQANSRTSGCPAG